MDKPSIAPPAEDILRGAEAISAFTGEPLSRTRYLLHTGQIPAGKVGHLWIASKRRLADFYAERMAGKVAA